MTVGFSSSFNEFIFQNTLEDGSECGSEIVDLNNESGEKGVDSPLKIPETQAVRVSLTLD